MKQKHYKLPLNLKTVLKKKPHPACSSVGESIAQNIHLIILTSFGDHRYDRNYGCSLWESDFEVIAQVNKWRTNISKSLTEIIEEHERRLFKVGVNVQVDQEEFLDPIDNKIKRIKKRIKIEVKGKLKKTNEAFNFSDTIYYSPISLD